MTDPSVVTVETRQNVILGVVLCARMDDEEARAVKQAIYAVASKAGDLPVVLDISRVEFLPSISLGALLNLSRQFKINDQRFILAGPRRDIRSVLAVTRLDKLFEISDDAEAAIAQLKLKPPAEA